MIMHFHHHNLETYPMIIMGLCHIYIYIYIYIGENIFDYEFMSYDLAIIVHDGPWVILIDIIYLQ